MISEMGQLVASMAADREAAEPLNRAAFDLLVAEYEAPLLRFLYGLVHDAEQAADLCQDTFLSAYRAAPRLTSGSAINAWLYTIALNHARGYLRRQRLLRWVPFVSGAHDRANASAPDLANRVAQHEELAELLRQLPVEQRVCLLLHADGFRYAEIARILGCSEGAVKLRMFRARERCLALYQARGDGEDEA